MKELIAKRLKLLRAAVGMNVPDVAYEIGYSATHVWQIERGASVANIVFIAKICELYDVSIDLLVYGTDAEFHELLNDFYATAVEEG